LHASAFQDSIINQGLNAFRLAVFYALCTGFVGGSKDIYVIHWTLRHRTPKSLMMLRALGLICYQG
jgi:hypothetical protein